MRVRTRFLAGFSAILALIATIVTLSVWHLQQTDHVIVKNASEQRSARQAKRENVEKRASSATLDSEVSRHNSSGQQEQEAHQLLQNMLEPARNNDVFRIHEFSEYQSKSRELATNETNAGIAGTLILLPVFGFLLTTIGLFLMALVTRSVRQQPGGVYMVGVVRDIAKADLTRQIDASLAASESLLQTAGAVRDGLANIVGEVRHHAGLNVAAPSEIASGSKDTSPHTAYQDNYSENAPTIEDEGGIAAGQAVHDNPKDRPVPNLYSRRSL